MSKKHFEAIAAAINNLNSSTDIRYLPGQSAEDNLITTAKLFGIRYAAEAVADACAASNPRFSRAQFLQACGVNESAK